jgi:magnesium chelatase family protein
MNIHTVELAGITGHVIDIEAYLSGRLPATILIGLPDSRVRETRDRVRAAMANSHLGWPDRKITVGLKPASLPKHGSGHDLAIAVAILAAWGQAPHPAGPSPRAGAAASMTVPPGTVFLAELGLDGRLRPVRGVLPAVVAAAREGFDLIVVAAGNRDEAALVDGVRVIAADWLADVATWLRGGPEPTAAEPPAPVQAEPLAAEPKKDLAEVLGYPGARRAAEICAAGGHHLALFGHDASKTMLAQLLSGIMPRLDLAAALEVTAVHSVAGVLLPGPGLIERPPVAAPHYTASVPFIVGGGTNGSIRPGAVSLAHQGVLLLNEAPEFRRDALDAVHQTLQAGQALIARQGMVTRFPARFTLVLTANSCPCRGTNENCDCSTAARRRHLGRLPGQLLDRVDLKVTMRRASRTQMKRDTRSADSSAVVAERVAAARDRAGSRLAGTPWRTNAEIPGVELRKSFALQPAALAAVEQAMSTGQLTSAGANGLIRVAWTLADLAGKSRPAAEEVSEALVLRLGTTS